MVEPTVWTFQIEGMTCDSCAKTIDETLRRVTGVIDSRTSYWNARARVVAEPWVDAGKLAEVIGRKGYKVTGYVAHKPRKERSLGDEELDLAVIGGGAAGFAAAIRAAELGAGVAIIERGTLGGTCVNVGCVPSKTMIRAAEVFHRASHHGFAGIRATLDPPDFKAIVAQKDELVAELRQAKYWDVLAAYPSVMFVRGVATFRDDGTVLVDGKPLCARKVVLAMGSHPWAPPIPGLDATPYLTSTEALSLEELPKTLVAIGGSAVGLEIAQLFARFGVKVSVLEALPRIVPAEDVDISDALTAYLRAEGVDIHTGVTVRRVTGTPGAYKVEVEEARKTHFFEAEQLLVATGRRANTRGIGLEEAGIRLGEKGEVVVNEYLETTREGIYAAGDVTGDPMLVYVAAYAGSVAAENALNGNSSKYDLSVVPRVTFTDPAVASVGFTEAQARAHGLAVAVSKLPLSHVPRALAARDTRGLIKLVADEKRSTLVGAHFLAPEAGEMVQAAAMAIRFGIRIDEIAAMLHPYLTHAEGLKLACQTFKKDVAKLSCCAA